VLVQLAHVIAPFTPFLAEELYRNLTAGESVHLNDWPKAGNINDQVVTEMDAVRVVVNEGLSERSKNQLKVRQPLLSINVSGMADLGPNSDLYLEVIKEELNVKQVNWSTEGEQAVSLDTNITEELKLEGLAREVVRFVQSARKEAGLEVDDRIHLTLNTDSEELNRAIKEHASYICSETLTTKLDKSVENGQESEHKIGDSVLNISLRVAN
jgi:isoleucyl-tRNA synthetase